MIEENLRSCKLKELYIQNLFFKYNYNIPFNDERITIIHGLNGSGKTTIFKLLNYFFKSKYPELHSIPFDFFEVTYEDNKSIRVYANRFLFEKNCVEDKRYFDFLNKEFYKNAIYAELKNKEGSLNVKRSQRYESYDYFRNKLKERDELFELIFEIKNPESQEILVIEHTVSYDYKARCFFNAGAFKIIEPSKNKFEAGFKNKIIEYLNLYSEEFFPRESYPNRLRNFFKKDLSSNDIEEINRQLEEIEEYLSYSESFGGEDPDPQLIVELYTLKKQQKNYQMEKSAREKESIPKIFLPPLYGDKSVYFIEAQRVIKIHSNYATRQLENDAIHLKGLIKEAYKESALELQKSEKEFINKFASGLNNIDEDSDWLSYIKSQLIPKMKGLYGTEGLQENVLGLLRQRDPELTDAERQANTKKFWEKYPKYNKEHNQDTIAEADGLLEDLGILFNKEHEGMRIKWEKPEIRLAIDTHLDGRINALKPFYNVAQKCFKLSEIVRKNFNEKIVIFPPEEGIIFYDSSIVAKQRFQKYVSGEEKAYPLFPGWLSSGEMHLLIIIYNILFRIPDNSLILIDEPEISLHISWQIKFIEILKEILEFEDKKNVQILIATHSPQIINGRWDLTVGLGAIE